MFDIRYEIASIRGAAGEIAYLESEISRWAGTARSLPSAGELRDAAATLNDASAQTTERLRALEQLFSVSVAHIADLKQKLSVIGHDAQHDPLTALANRRRFDAFLRDAADTADNDGTPLTLLLIDIDHFKRFNDTYGHTLGDDVLRLVGRMLADNTRRDDLAARYGGEEFAIVLPNTDLAVGIAVAEDLRRRIARQRVVDRATGNLVDAVTCSIGVAEYRMAEATDALTDRADQAMYRAKDAGRNRVEAADPAMAWIFAAGPATTHAEWF